MDYYDRINQAMALTSVVLRDLESNHGIVDVYTIDYDDFFPTLFNATNVYPEHYSFHDDFGTATNDASMVCQEFCCNDTFYDSIMNDNGTSLPSTTTATTAAAFAAAAAAGTAATTTTGMLFSSSSLSSSSSLATAAVAAAATTATSIRNCSRPPSTTFFFDNDDNSNSDDTSFVTTTDFSNTEILITTMKMYGAFYFLLFLFFSFGQKFSPHLFNLRSWVPHIQCPLAMKEYGFFDWMWEVYKVSDDEILEQCGMDALCFIRMFGFGRKLAIFGCIQALYLLPLYFTAPKSEEFGSTNYYKNHHNDNKNHDDDDHHHYNGINGQNSITHLFVVKDDIFGAVSAATIDSSSNRLLLPTVFAAYMVFLFTMRQLLKEFKWYTKYRHKFLMQRKPRNYTILVTGVPPIYRSSYALMDYFQQCNFNEDVLEARIVHDLPQAISKMNRRAYVIRQIERARLYEKKFGRPYVVVRRQQSQQRQRQRHLQQQQRPYTFNVASCFDWFSEWNQWNVETLDQLEKELDDLNRYITGSINKVLQKNDRFRCHLQKREGGKHHFSEHCMDNQHKNDQDHRDHDPNQNNATIAFNYGNNHHTCNTNSTYSTTNINGATTTTTTTTTNNNNNNNQDHHHTAPHILDRNNSSTTEESSRVTAAVVNTVKQGAEAGTMILKKTAAAVAHVGLADGNPRDAGFVTFTDLYATQAAKQMIHHPKPYVMKVKEAPDPEDIYWKYVGLPEEARRIGWLLSMAGTVFWCILATIPVAIISSLRQLGPLQEAFPIITVYLVAIVRKTVMLTVFAPVLILFMRDTVLPIPLRFFTEWEGHVSVPDMVDSLFIKIATFTIIQTFFVYAISSSIFAKIRLILCDPTYLFTILAEFFPNQSTIFIQLILADTFIVQGLKLLRVVSLLKATVRHFVGPNFTEKERTSVAYGFLHPLEDPPPFDHAKSWARLILFFMIYFVYSTIAPMVNFFLLFCFILMESGVRYNFYHNWNPKSDSGGKHWIGLMQIMLASMIIAQLTLAGLLVIKKNLFAVPLMVPVIVGTLYFIYFLHWKPLEVTRFLPTRECLQIDHQYRQSGSTNFDFAKGTYIQPSLRHSVLYPDPDPN